MKIRILKTIRNIFDGVMIFLLLLTATVYALPSDGVIYDNSESGSSATNVNDALNDLYSKLNQKQEELNNINNIGNAASNHILKGYTAYVKGKTVTGTIPSKGAATYTPGTKDQTIASGNYLSGIQTIKGDANLVASNIAKGKTIFGVTGTASCSNMPVSSYSNVLTTNAYTYYMVKTYGRNIKVQLKNEAGSVAVLTYVVAYGQNNVYLDDSVIYASPYETKLTVDKNTGIIADSGSYEYILIKNSVSGSPKFEFVFTWL